MDDSFDLAANEFGNVSPSDYGTGQQGATTYAVPDSSALLPTSGGSQDTPSTVLPGALSSGVFGGSPSLGDGFGGATGSAGANGALALTNGGGASGTNTLPDAGYNLKDTAGITHGTSPTSGSSDKGSVLHQLAAMVQDDKGNLDLTKLVKVGTGLGGVFEAYQRNRNATAAKAQQLQAAAISPAQNSWSPAAAAQAGAYFGGAQNRTPLRPSTQGISSIVPASVTRPQMGYAAGGKVTPGEENIFQHILDSIVSGQAPATRPAPKESGVGLTPLVPTLQYGGDEAPGMAEGGALAMTSPQGQMSHGTYGLISGPGDGQSDSIPINAAAGEYMMDAETVSMLGNGDNNAGAQALDAWREALRAHKRSAPPDQIAPPTGPDQLPPTGVQ